MKKKDRVKRSGAGTGARSEAAPRDPIPTHADLVVVGGGPHAVALVTRILTRGEVLTDANGPLTGYRKSPKDVRRHLFRTPVDESLKRSIVVIDKSGGWMLNWQRQYRAFGIEHLRSPRSLHPDPYDHSALRVWANQVKLEKDQFVDMKVLSEKRKPTDGNGRGRRRGEAQASESVTLGVRSRYLRWTSSRSFPPILSTRRMASVPSFARGRSQG